MGGCRASLSGSRQKDIQFRVALEHPLDKVDQFRFVAPFERGVHVFERDEPSPGAPAMSRRGQRHACNSPRPPPGRSNPRWRSHAHRKSASTRYGSGCEPMHDALSVMPCRRALMIAPSRAYCRPRCQLCASKRARTSLLTQLWDRLHRTFHPVARIPMDGVYYGSEGLIAYPAYWIGVRLPIAIGMRSPISA